MKKSNDKLQEKLSSGKKTSDKDLFSLSWTVDELSRLNRDGRDMYVELLSITDLLKDKTTDVIQRNMARRLSTLYQVHLKTWLRLTSWWRFTHKLHSLQRLAPTHINGVIEQRKAGEYKITFELYYIVGFVSNGAFRVKGFTRPVSVLKLRSDARNKFSSYLQCSRPKMVSTGYTN